MRIKTQVLWTTLKTQRNTDAFQPLGQMLCEQNLWHQIKKGFILLASDDSDEVALAAIGLHGLRELRQLGQVGLGQKLGPLGVVEV